MKFIDWFIPTKTNNFKAKLLKHEGMIMLIIMVMTVNYFVSQLPENQVSAQVDLNSIVYAHNRERGKYDLNPLSLSSSLINSATKKAEAMLESNCWDHYCPLPPGVSPWKWFADVDYKYEHAGENLAEGFRDNETVMKAWMNSPTHRDNVLKNSFEEIGIGFAAGEYQNKSMNTIIVVHFGKPIRGGDVTNFVVEEENDRILDNLQILTPPEGRFINKSELLIRGKADMIGDGIELVLNNTYKYFVEQDENGYFEFDLTEKNEIVDDEYRFRFSLIKDEKKYYETEHNLTVISTPPLIENKDVAVLDIVESDKVSLRISVPKPNLFQNGWIEISEQKYSGRVIGESVVFTVDYDYFENSNYLKIVLFDEAGNEGINIVPTEILLSQLERLGIDNMGQSEISVAQGDLEFEDIYTSWLDYRLPSLSSQQIINLFLLLAISIILIFDYVILKKNGLDELLVGGKHHFKLSLIFTIGIILVISGGVGNILTGTTI
jgi:uncharacterized protein YkwD